MDTLIAHPSRNLVRVALFVAVVWAVPTLGYAEAGWSLQDALYMVTLTVFTVGCGEVHPIDTAYLHILTMVTMMLGCTGMIFFTGALAQVFTLSPLQQIIGGRRMHSEIEKLEGHVIICGFGRIGVELARALKDGRAPFVMLEQDDRRPLQGPARKGARRAPHLLIAKNDPRPGDILDYVARNPRFAAPAARTLGPARCPADGRVAMSGPPYPGGEPRPGFAA